MRTVRNVLAPLLLVGVLVGLVVAGCSNAESGTPVAGDPPATAGSTTGPGTTGQSTSDTPPPVDRPRPIDLSTVDICQVVGGLPLRDYRLDGDRPPLAGESDLFPGSRDCFANGIRDNVSLLVIAVTTEGARSFVDSANVTAATDSVAAGYPLTVLTPSNPATCLGVLDVHDGQMLYLSYGVGSPLEQPLTPQADLCRTVPSIATAAVGALG